MPLSQNTSHLESDFFFKKGNDMATRRINWNQKQDVNIPLTLREVFEILDSCFDEDERVELIIEFLCKEGKEYKEAKKWIEQNESAGQE